MFVRFYIMTTILLLVREKLKLSISFKSFHTVHFLAKVAPIYNGPSQTTDRWTPAPPHLPWYRSRGIPCR